MLPLIALSFFFLCFVSQTLCRLEKEFSFSFSTTTSSPILQEIVGHLSEKEKEQVMQRLPWEIQELGVGSIEWGNQIMQVVWSCVLPYFFRQINGNLEWELDIPSLAKFTLKMDDLKVGIHPLQVSGIRVYS